MGLYLKIELNGPDKDRTFKIIEVEIPGSTGLLDKEKGAELKPIEGGSGHEWILEPKYANYEYGQYRIGSTYYEPPLCVTPITDP